MNEKVSYISKKIVTEITDYKVYKELSKNKEINICLNALFEVFFWEFILISPN